MALQEDEDANGDTDDENDNTDPWDDFGEDDKKSPAFKKSKAKSKISDVMPFENCNTFMFVYR